LRIVPAKVVAAEGVRDRTRESARWLAHDPEKWEPVSRLREAWARLFIWLDASAGGGRSEKDHAQTKA
jgi:hypothetical protein